MTIAGNRLYAIGDIHGRLDLLEQIIELINRDIKSHPGEAVIVTLGDYVDRGPDSSGVLDRWRPTHSRVDMSLSREITRHCWRRFLNNPAVGPDWWRLGGLETVKSFGIAVTPKMKRTDFERVARQLRDAMTSHQVGFSQFA